MAGLAKAKVEVLNDLAAELEVVGSWMSGGRKAKVDVLVDVVKGLAAGETPQLPEQFKSPTDAAGNKPQ